MAKAKQRIDIPPILLRAVETLLKEGKIKSSSKDEYIQDLVTRDIRKLMDTQVLPLDARIAIEKTGVLKNEKRV